MSDATSENECQLISISSTLEARNIELLTENLVRLASSGFRVSVIYVINTVPSDSYVRLFSERGWRLVLTRCVYHERSAALNRLVGIQNANDQSAMTIFVDGDMLLTKGYCRFLNSGANLSEPALFVGDRIDLNMTYSERYIKRKSFTNWGKIVVYKVYIVRSILPQLQPNR